MSALWSRAQFTDRLFVAYFVGLGALIAWHHDRIAGWPALLAAHAAAVALIAAAVVLADRFRAVHAWYPLLVPLFTFPEVARLNLAFVHSWQDAPLLAFEGRLFAEPPTVWLPSVVPPLLAEIFRAGYLSYFLLLLIVAGVFRHRRDEASFRGVVAASVLAYVGCYAIFLAWPMEGPAHTLRHLGTGAVSGGPLRALVLLVQQAGVHGNAFPSAHVAGALPPLVFAIRHDRRLGAAIALAVALMGLGAVHDGYHYASDVVAGAVVGAAAAGLVLAAQRRPSWARRIGLPPADGSDAGGIVNGRDSRGGAVAARSFADASKARPTRLPAGSSSSSSTTAR
jgi:membrane-associated phospholipid phosphatase